MKKGKAVRYWSYLDDYSIHRDDYLRICDEVMYSGRLIMGNRLLSLERKIAEACRSAHAAGVASGTDAIFLSLKALGVGQGDEVITVSNTAVPTVAALRAAGATPVFVDVEEETFLMDTALLEKAITARTRCILPVHLFGQMVDMQPVLRLADFHKLYVIEDCAQAFGASYKGQTAGSMGNTGAFSFYPTKVLAAFGDGGMVTTSDTELYYRLLGLRNYGMGSSYSSEQEGYNSRLDELQAALLERRLENIGESVTKRQRIAALYDKGLSETGDIAIPAVRPMRSHQYYVYTIRTSYRDRLMNYLASHEIETKINYPVPVHLMPAYAFLGYKSGSLPVTERLASTLLSLPMYPELPEEHTEAVIAACRNFFKRTT